jgi:hypothetical protein
MNIDFKNLGAVNIPSNLLKEFVNDIYTLGYKNGYKSKTVECGEYYSGCKTQPLTDEYINERVNDIIIHPQYMPSI